MSDRGQRRLAAIVAADVAGYSRLVGADEEGVLAALLAHRSELIDPLLAQYRGRVANTAGDSLLVEFPSVVEALRCAIAWQAGIAERNAEVPEDRCIEFRIGINLGDVIEQDGDLLGDGVNVAARLEGLAQPGGICMSRAARDQVRDRMDVTLVDLGEVEVKNIARPVRAFQVAADAAAPRKAARRQSWAKPWQIVAVVTLLVLVTGVGGVWFVLRPLGEVIGIGSSLAAATSIAVLPFSNLSKDPDQEYFADGITNDLITDLSRFQELFVIASNSAFTYKGRPVKVQEVGRELGVRYVLEGSVQRQGDRVRINAQLINAGNGQHLWAERYDEAAADLFDLQDRIAMQIVRTLAVKLTRLEQQRAAAKPTQDLEAYDYALRGRQLLASSTRRDNYAARRMFEEAIARDPDYGVAYAGLGRSYYEAVLFGWTEAPQAAIGKAVELAHKAIELGTGAAEGHDLLAGVHLIRRQHDLALVEAERAIALNPNDARFHANQGAILVWSSHEQGAILALETALRYDPFMGERPLTHLGMAYYLAGRYEDAVNVVQRALGLNADFAHGHVVLAAALAQLGRLAEATRAADAVRRLDPFFSTDSFGRLMREPADAAALVEGLRKAGLG